jgi:hypothetical protein
MPIISWRNRLREPVFCGRTHPTGRRFHVLAAKLDGGGNLEQDRRSMSELAGQEEVRRFMNLIERCYTGP